MVWYLEGNPRLGSRAKLILDDAAADLVLPLIALAEAAYIVERGRTSLSCVTDLLERVEADRRITVSPITWDVLRQSLSAIDIPEMHDRLIVGTAMHLQQSGHTVVLLTKDTTIAMSRRAAVLW
ncbi:MAG: PIN domain-containing protein [Chloroflexota bacterium]|nr:PIN domain-containing protein [Chloroflexota bacterium]